MWKQILATFLEINLTTFLFFLPGHFPTNAFDPLCALDLNWNKKSWTKTAVLKTNKMCSFLLHLFQWFFFLLWFAIVPPKSQNFGPVSEVCVVGHSPSLLYFLWSQEKTKCVLDKSAGGCVFLFFVVSFFSCGSAFCVDSRFFVLNWPAGTENRKSWSFHLWFSEEKPLPFAHAINQVNKSFWLQNPWPNGLGNASQKASTCQKHPFGLEFCDWCGQRDLGQKKSLHISKILKPWTTNTVTHNNFFGEFPLTNFNEIFRSTLH